MVDVAFQSCVIAAFSTMVYFSTGLVREPGAFFTFVLTIVTGYVCMSLLFRTIGILSPDFGKLHDCHHISVRTNSILKRCRDPRRRSDDIVVGSHFRLSDPVSAPEALDTVDFLDKSRGPWVFFVDDKRIQETKFYLCRPLTHSIRPRI
jgi:hypothetical protein